MTVALAPILTPAGSIPCGALVVVAGICVLAVYKVRATVSEAGLTIEYFPFLGWPTTRIKASESQSVEAIHVEPREHGGGGTAAASGSLAGLPSTCVVDLASPSPSPRTAASSSPSTTRIVLPPHWGGS